ncbi:MAG: GH3 auxin-responsive promoter family protein [Methanobrevibacter sp.]
MSNIDMSKLTFSGKLNLKFISDGGKVYKGLMEMTKDPMKYNTELLMKIIEDNKDTEYGKKYDFASIKSIEDYRKKVPITAYDDYAEYIYRATEKGEKNLISNYHITHYAKSSGTMGNPKRIPVSKEGLDINNKYNYAFRAFITTQLLGIDWINAPFLNLIESFVSKLKSGDDYGSISGKLIDNFGGELSNIVTSPIEGLMPNTDTDTRYVHARFALIRDDITYTVSSFVSLFLELLRYIKDNWKILVDDIEKGTINENVRIPDHTRESLLTKIEPMPERAKELRKIFEEGFNEPIVKKIWPQMSVLVGIGTGGFSDYLEKIKEFTGPDFNFFLVGLTASEGMFSIPFELNNKESILIPDSMFYEFLALENQGDYSKVITMDQMEVGKDYEVITTNLSGFYRYRMKDVVRCVGKLNSVPKIEFLYRLDQCMSLTGEKVNEENLRDAAYKTERDLGFDLIDFSVYPDKDISPMRYVYLMEVQDLPDNLSKEDIQDKLNENFCLTDPVLGYKIEKGMIGKTGLYFLQPETYLLYKELRVAHGTSSAQVKPPRILRDEPIRKFFSVLLDDELN